MMSLLDDESDLLLLQSLFACDTLMTIQLNYTIHAFLTFFFCLEFLLEHEADAVFRNMSHADEDWDSDSDDDLEIEGTETSVLLGLPDGVIDDDADLRDAAVSRIGGSPALITPTEPSYTSSFCKICNQPMELLVQLLCPFEQSPYDRALYIWGCSKSSCQTKSTPKGGR